MHQKTKPKQNNLKQKLFCFASNKTGTETAGNVCQQLVNENVYGKKTLKNKKMRSARKQRQYTETFHEPK